ncbi:MAG: UvrD-helicase domain-containing protein [Opitutales bacterium]|nr:UvrD-helicase domain-containing protein [Opitutales bacterium]
MFPAEPTSALALTRSGIIEASAGTGKTFTIAEIYLALLRGEKFLHADAARAPAEKNPAPRVRDILVVTFTDAATAELRARLRKKIREAVAENSADEKTLAALRLADAEFDEAAVFTIHGFCLRVLKEFGISSRVGEIRTSLSEELSRFAARWRARKIAEGESIFFKVEADDICEVLSPLLQNPDIVPVPPNADDALGNALYRAATEALAEWNALRKDARDISFGEILIALRDALRRDPGLAKRIAARFRVAVVDEFQDTDPVQWEIFRNIFLAQKNPIFCVGDPKQAIYEFRGGDIHTYRKARREILAASGGNALSLVENWRSEPAAIAAFNEIFSFDKNICNTLSIGTKKAPREVSAEIGGLLDYVPVAFPSKKIGKEKFDTQKKIPAAILKITDAESEKSRAKKLVLDQAVADISDLVKHRGVPASSIAVLVFNNDEANLYRNALARENIPVSTTARGNVLCEAIASALSDVLHAMLEPQSTGLFRRALLTPFFAETGKQILRGNGISDTAETVRQAFADAHTRWKKHGVLSAFRSLADTLGFFQNLAKQKSATALATNVLHLTEILHATEQNSALLPRALVNAFDSMISSANPKDDSAELQLRADSDSAAVRILTVHKSKGLEFEIVFMSSLWSKSLYSNRSAGNFAKGSDADGKTVLFFDSGKEKSEAFVRARIERTAANDVCLFYVALTRARSRVVVYHVPQKPSGSGWNSYQKLLLDAALGTFEKNPEELAHWRVLQAREPLPEESFPKRETPCESANADDPRVISEEEAEMRFSIAENVRQKIARNAEGIFSFSKIIHATESDSTSNLREDDETLNPEVADGNADVLSPDSAGTPEADSFPKRSFSDLPVGAEFGTLAHFIFEKTDFRTRENLGALADGTLAHFPNWQKLLPAEQVALRKKLIDMVEENLALRLFPQSGFRLEMLEKSDAVHEMEFHFPLKRSRNLYAGLFRIFKSWGGIYAKTADYHWAQNARGGAESPLNIAGMMTGVIDLVFRVGGKFFILDWKTNMVASTAVPADFCLSADAVRDEIVKHGYALQWTIYALALRKFLKTSLGESYVHERDFGGIVYLFVRWCAPFIDAGTLTDARLDELEKELADVSAR